MQLYFIRLNLPTGIFQKMKILFSTLILVFFLLNISTSLAQNKVQRELKPANKNSANYKEARRLYKKVRYEAGYFVMDYKKAKKLFKGKSGIAIETIATDELLSLPAGISETYRKKQDEDQLTGTITSITNKHELFKESKDLTSEMIAIKILKDKIQIPLRPKYFVFKVDKDTKDTIKNLIIYRKSAICKIQPFTPFTGELYTTPFPSIPLQFSRPFREFKDVIGREHISDTIVFRLYYERGKFELDETKIELIKSQFPESEKIKHIDIIGFASIEGNIEVNQDLYQRRVNEVMNFIKTQTGDGFTSRTHSMENWSMFRNQIERTDDEFLSVWDRDKVRAYVNKHYQEEGFEEMLDEQRYVEVKVAIEQVVDAAQVPVSPKSYYEKILAEIKASNFRAGQNKLNLLEDIQVHLYTKTLEDRSVTAKKMELEIPDHPSMKALLFNQMVYDYLGRFSDHSAKWYFDLWIEMGNQRQTPYQLKSAIRFNTQLFLFKAVEDYALSYYIQDDLLPEKAYRDYIFHLRSKPSKSVSKEPYDRLVLAYLPRFINDFQATRLNDEQVEDLYRFYHSRMNSSYYWNFYPETKAKAERHLRDTFFCFSDAKIRNDKERLRISLLYGLFQKWEKAIQTLEPLLEVPEYKIIAKQLTLCYLQNLVKYEDMINIILESGQFLGFADWAAMFERPDILGPRYFDNAKIRKVYLTGKFTL